jgi:hypothetical protein
LAAIEVVILGFTPVLAFGGSLFGHLVTRKSATELDRWRKREETMRMLRWSTELAVDRDEDRARAGLVVLRALLDSPLLDEEDIQLVATVAADVAAHLVEREGDASVKGR